MTDRTTIVKTPDATLRRYARECDRLTLEFNLWDESAQLVTVHGIARLEDEGTWEADAVVRLPELDQNGKLGYGIIDVEGKPTMRFVADGVDIGEGAPRQPCDGG